MTRIELIIDSDCPNASRARKEIESALTGLNMPLKWTEWERSSPDAPPYAKAYGSPTVLVDGRDVGGAQPGATSNSCRLYGPDGARAPSAAAIMSMLASAKVPPFKAGGLAGTLPAVGLALLPKLTCAACFPAYAAILGALGIGVWNYTPYLLPLTVISLGVVLFSLIFRASKRRGYLPFLAGLAASLVILVGKFQFQSDAGLYLGIAGLVAASLWNTWPKRALTEPHCNTC